jgi:hypothetical protein
MSASNLALNWEKNSTETSEMLKVCFIETRQREEDKFLSGYRSSKIL